MLFFHFQWVFASCYDFKKTIPIQHNYILEIVTVKLMTFILNNINNCLFCIVTSDFYLIYTFLPLIQHKYNHLSFSNQSLTSNNCLPFIELKIKPKVRKKTIEKILVGVMHTACVRRQLLIIKTNCSTRMRKTLYRPTKATYHW